MGDQRHNPAALPREREPVTIMVDSPRIKAPPPSSVGPTAGLAVLKKGEIFSYDESNQYFSVFLPVA